MNAAGHIQAQRSKLDDANRVHLDTIRQLAAFHLCQGSLDVAEKLTAIGVWLDPSDTTLRRLRANALSRQGKPTLAIRQLVEAKKIDGSKVKISDWVTVGIAFAKINDIDHAKMLLSR